jgi:hypothetical protein
MPADAGQDAEDAERFLRLRIGNPHIHRQKGRLSVLSATGKSET